jgi:dCMP deaminase
VLVDKDNRVLSIGHNGPAKGMQHCTDKPCAGADCPSGTGLDLCQAIHAEQNALMFCSDIMKIDKCFVTVSPCIHCVKMLMNTSCKTIIFASEYSHNTQAQQLWEQDPTRKWVKA